MMRGGRGVAFAFMELWPQIVVLRTPTTVGVVMQQDKKNTQWFLGPQPVYPDQIIYANNK